MPVFYLSNTDCILEIVKETFLLPFRVFHHNSNRTFFSVSRTGAQKGSFSSLITPYNSANYSFRLRQMDNLGLNRGSVTKSHHKLF